MKPDLEAIRKRFRTGDPPAWADVVVLLKYVGELEAVMTKGQKWRRSMMTESERAVEVLKCPGDSSDLEYEQAQVHRMTCESSLMQALAALEEAP